MQGCQNPTGEGCCMGFSSFWLIWRMAIDMQLKPIMFYRTFYVEFENGMKY
jgi:hypothetical protein